MSFLFDPIINIWLSITDLASTGIGQYLDNIIYTIIGLVVVVVGIGFLANWVSTPSSLTVDKIVDNEKRASNYKARKCCLDCKQYNSYTGECNFTDQHIEDPKYRVCSFYTPSR